MSTNCTMSMRGLSAATERLAGKQAIEARGWGGIATGPGMRLNTTQALRAQPPAARPANRASDGIPDDERFASDDPMAPVSRQRAHAVLGAVTDPLARRERRPPLVFLQLRAPRILPRDRTRVPPRS